MLYPVADDVVCNAPQRLLRIVVVSAQLPRTIPQHFEAAFNLRICAGAASDPITCQAAHSRSAISAAATAGLFSTEQLAKCRSNAHQNLTNKL